MYEQNTWLFIFRLWVLLRLFIWIFNEPLVWVFTFGRGNGPLTGGNLYLAIWAELVVVILSWSPALRIKLGRRHTDIMVAIHIITVIFINFLWNYAPLEMGNLKSTQLLILNRGWSLFLLVSTVLLAWQYRFRSVIISVSAMIITDILLLYIKLPWDVFSQIALSSVFNFFGLALIGYIICLLVVQLKSRNKSLHDMNRKLANHAATIEELAISWERNRLAQELHDTLAHSLSALAVQLEAVRSLWDVDNEKAFSLLNQADEITRNGLSEARGALQALRAVPLQDLGLINALENLADESAERINANLIKDIPDTPIADISMHLEQTIYRIAQESLENVVRHSMAKNITLRLTLVAEQPEFKSLIMEVSDDGIGFDIGNIQEPIDPNQQRWGLIGLQERAALVGGSLDIISSPGSGTRIRLHIKLGETGESNDQHSYL